ncbi:helix-turn-helix domain-containing protein [Pseudoflavitalea sp. G-6-1-2]|uniref:helix-turn-helix domain-containing protein n=1 Tax=Pseudoflavitalea sp. G-6-1-2 TaxID=2728841 RepID=UPI00146C02B7|nr:helix-turn-helix domain-containing protein [Pseudoflavitalea sp. G-6-1-2]NML21032.1 helix-turn-helix domain-containing protein [Pseudoflavitalea sp. G-6-1-2]
MTQTSFSLIDPQSKNLALNLFAFEDDHVFREQQLRNYYCMVLVSKGKGRLNVDYSEYSFEAGQLMCFSVYQPFVIRAESDFEGYLVCFHPDFFCIHKHQDEVGCNGVLFNNAYGSPIVELNTEQRSALLAIIDHLKTEVQHEGPARMELLLSYLKIFLIQASRFKLSLLPEVTVTTEKEPFILKTLKDAIEEHYRSKHGAAEYASLLNITPKALNKITKQHFNRTLSNLISERIIIEAKRELYLTSKPVKAIAYELGFSDEFYFSRFFKNNASVSPQTYRTTVGFAKGE